MLHDDGLNVSSGFVSVLDTAGYNHVQDILDKFSSLHLCDSSETHDHLTAHWAGVWLSTAEDRCCYCYCITCICSSTLLRHTGTLSICHANDLHVASNWQT